MFSHVMLGSNDIEESKDFYDATLTLLNYSKGVLDDKGRYFYLQPGGTFAITVPINGDAATPGNGMTIGFMASSSDLVNEWHKVGIEHGGSPCEDPPGVRESAGKKVYMAYLRDPSGNKICATHFLF